MSLKKVEQAKKDRGFRIFDLIVYGAIVVVIAVLFIVIFSVRDKSPLKGICVYIDSAAVFRYNFEEDEPVVLTEDGSVVIEKNNSTELVVNFYTGGSGYNVMTVNKTARSVSLTDANCRGRECVYTAAIKDNNGIIYCAPHKLKIEPSDYEPDNGYIPL